MNNNMPNEKNNKDEGLNSFSLGNMDLSQMSPNSTPPVPPVENEIPASSLETQAAPVNQSTIQNTTNSSSVAAPEPTIDSLNMNDSVDTASILQGQVGIVPPLQTAQPQVSPVTSVPPVAPVPPIKPVNPTPVPEPVNTIAYDIPQVINEPPVFNDIGLVPPIANIPIPNMTETSEETDKEKKKKKENKTLFVIVVILALAIVATLVYVILNKAQKKALPVIPKEVNIEINSAISTDINDYATFKNISSVGCSLDTTAITDTSIYNAQYTFTISCEGVNYTGKAKIVDTIEPKVTVKVVKKTLNATIKADEFIESCEDATKCSIAFKDEEKAKGFTSSLGSYHVDIIVSDEAGNKTEATATLEVTSMIADKYLSCVKELNGYTLKYKLGLEDNAFNKTAIMETYIFSFETDSSYQAVKDSSVGVDEITYKDITGKPEFDDENKTMSFNNKLTYEELNTKFNTTIPLPVGELRDYFKAQGYTVTFEF